MTESQRIVLNWRERLKQIGWPEDAIKECIVQLCEAGYRACIEEIQERIAKKNALIAKVAKN